MTHPMLLEALAAERAAEMRRSLAAGQLAGRDAPGRARRRSRRVGRAGRVRQPVGWLLVDVGLRLAAPPRPAAGAARPVPSR